MWLYNIYIILYICGYNMEYPHSYMGYQPLANWGISRSGCWVPYFSYLTSSGPSHCSVTLKLCLLLPSYPID